MFAACQYPDEQTPLPLAIDLSHSCPNTKGCYQEVKGFYLALHYLLTSTHEQFAALPRLSLVGLLD